MRIDELRKLPRMASLYDGTYSAANTERMDYKGIRNMYQGGMTTIAGTADMLVNIGWERGDAMQFLKAAKPA